MSEESPFRKDKKQDLENQLIYRKSLLKGQTKKIAQDNIKLKENLRQVVRNFLKKEAE
ncbi:hypothetical protein MYP_3884 [Sporocytophaga myxococcoides]|uniref:Uncharacterized protein n=1 Tax=Sporocytophaga myxococcoides TaxID=153721 RepID=A0A098LJJ1_9BACT|nr:hypothetical protein [Sporocytophaga myxococcoides]GAL86654.1 hypothetical protein MYP_3884 [Sporocytophaga myxococcoides]